MGNRVIRGKRIRKTLLVFCLAMAVLAVLSLPVLRSKRILLRRWQDELQSLPDEEVPQQLRRVAALHSDGIQPLVKAMASERDVVANAAGELLREQMNDWQSLPEREATRRVALMTRQLAKNIDRIRGPQLLVARELATRALMWPMESDHADSVAITADSEVILRAVSSEAFSRTEPDFSSSSKPKNTITVSFGDSDESSNLPPIMTAEDVADRPALEMSRTQPVSTNSNEAGQQRRTNPEPLTFHAARNEANGNIESTALSPIDLSELRESSELELMSLLHSFDRRFTDGARSELRRRGFQLRHLELAKRLTHPDADIRRQLAEALPLIEGLDERPWLLWLIGDNDASVRLAAVSILGTSSDLEVLKRLHDLEQVETDSSVLEQVRRVFGEEPSKR